VTFFQFLSNRGESKKAESNHQKILFICQGNFFKVELTRLSFCYNSAYYSLATLAHSTPLGKLELIVTTTCSNHSSHNNRLNAFTTVNYQPTNINYSNMKQICASISNTNSPEQPQAINWAPGFLPFFLFQLETERYLVVETDIFKKFSPIFGQ